MFITSKHVLFEMVSGIAVEIKNVNANVYSKLNSLLIIFQDIELIYQSSQQVRVCVLDHEAQVLSQGY